MNKLTFLYNLRTYVLFFSFTFVLKLLVLSIMVRREKAVMFDTKRPDLRQFIIHLNNGRPDEHKFLLDFKADDEHAPLMVRPEAAGYVNDEIKSYYGTLDSREESN